MVLPFFCLFLAACLGVVRHSLSTALNLLAFVRAHKENISGATHREPAP